MNLQTLNDWKYIRRIDPEVTRKKWLRDRGIGLWCISVEIDLKRLLEHRGGHDSIIETFLRVPKLIQHSSSTEIGEEVELTFEERKSLKITSIRPFDVSWRECRKRYKDERNRRKRERDSAQRSLAGARPRGMSLASLKPWQAEGISRSTWYANLKKSLLDGFPPTALDDFPPPPYEVGGCGDSSPTHCQTCGQIGESCQDCLPGDPEKESSKGNTSIVPSASQATQPSDPTPSFQQKGIPMKSVLHDYQSQALEDIRNSVRSGIRRLVVQAPTGAGKTKLAAAIVDSGISKGSRMAFCVPAISLVDQTVESFYAEGIRGIGVIQANHEMTDWSQPVQICSIQTIQARKAFPEAKTVIFDECHRLFEAHKAWLGHADWQTIPFIGLSATPWAKGMKKHFSSLLKVIDTRSLIDRGYLSKFRVFATGHPDLSTVKTVAGDYHEGDLSNAMQQGSLTADIVKTYQEKWGKGKTLCFAVDKAHAQLLQERFQHAGIKCGYQDADTPADERREIRRKFHNGEYEVVCNIQTLTTGVDWDVRCLILARPTKSEMLYVQIIGRALRTAPGKDEALILDHSSTTAQLGFVTDIDHDELDDGKPTAKNKPRERKEPLPRECEGCAYLMPRWVKACPNCGKSTKPICSLVENDGELVEIVPGKLLKVGTKKVWSYEEKKVFLSELKGYAVDKGYRPGWAAVQFRTKFGEFPDKYLDQVEPSTVLSPATVSWVKSRQIAWAKSKANGESAAL